MVIFIRLILIISNTRVSENLPKELAAIFSSPVRKYRELLLSL